MEDIAILKILRTFKQLIMLKKYRRSVLK